MHKSFAELFLPYFSQKTLETLCYNVIVLPLQKRVSEPEQRCLLTQYPNHADNNLLSLNSRPL